MGSVKWEPYTYMRMHMHSSLWYVDGLWVPLLISYVSGILSTGTYVYDVVVSCYVLCAER